MQSCACINWETHMNSVTVTWSSFLSWPKCNSNWKLYQTRTKRQCYVPLNIYIYNGFNYRKRSREDDLPCESTPLSKRINNLHLNYDDGNSSSSSNCSIPNLINDNNNYLLLPTITGGGCGSGPAEVVGGVYEYNPELNADQNPYYYEKNKMLYDLHVERVKRSNH